MKYEKTYISKKIRFTLSAKLLVTANAISLQVHKLVENAVLNYLNNAYYEVNWAGEDNKLHFTLRLKYYE